MRYITLALRSFNFLEKRKGCVAGENRSCGEGREVQIKIPVALFQLGVFGGRWKGKETLPLKKGV